LNGATGSAFWLDNTGTRLRLSAGASPNSITLSTTVDSSGNLYAPAIDASSATTLGIGTGTATALTLGSTSAKVAAPGGLTVAAAKTIDVTTAGTLSLGTATATAVTVGSASAIATAPGGLKVDATNGVDISSAGTLKVGASTATAVTLGSTTAPATVPGGLTVQNDSLVESTTGDFVHKIVRSGTTLMTISNVSTGAAIINSNNGAALEFGASSGTQRTTNQFQITSTTVKSNSGFATTRTAITYSASMTADASTGNLFPITATNATAFTINAPTNPATGQRITFTIRNTSGGALGVATWDAVFKMAAWTQPATANSRSIDFTYDGTNWIEVARTAADVPN
jgi:hypothetical protein